MSVWAIIDCEQEQRSFRICVCLCCHVIPLVHLTQWIWKDQQYRRQWEVQTQREDLKISF